MKRWLAIVSYDTENGVVRVEHDIEELSELEQLVENGPDFRSIVSIKIEYQLNEDIPIKLNGVI